MGTSRRAEALALLGLARRAGALVKGTDATRKALRRGEVRLVLLATDGSLVQREKILPLARGKDVPVVILGTRIELGSALGSGPLTAVAVTQAGFAKELEAKVGRN